MVLHAKRRLSSYLWFLCGVMALSMLTASPAEAAASLYEAPLRAFLLQDPSHFNEHMWALIAENPEAKNEIFAEAVTLSLEKQIAVNPGAKAELLAKFKQLYPQLADRLDAAFLDGSQIQAAISPPPAGPLKTIQSYSPPTAYEMSQTTWWERNWPWVALGTVVVGGATAGIIIATSSKSEDAPPPGFPNPPTVGEAAEYSAQHGLEQIGAGAANARGFAGQGITVAVLDSGLNTLHPDMVNNIAPGGYDFISGSENVTDHSDVTHGTHVAGIIAAGKNDFGTRGVAYNAKILPFAVIGDGAPDTAIGDAMRAATAAGARVMNGSYGPGTEAIAYYENARAQLFTDFDLADANAYLAAAQSGMVMVFAAGNSGMDDVPLMASHPLSGGFLPFVRPANANIPLGDPGAYRKYNNDNSISTLNADYSGLEGQVIAVVAVDSTNTIAPFSNHCGVAKAWCFAAPGVHITSTGPENTYVALSGTSMASPHVAGAVALLLSQHPELTGPQLLNLLATTATHLGISTTGTPDDIYGWGLINLDLATQAVAPFSVALHGMASGPSVLLTNSTVRVGNAFGPSVARALGSTQIGVMDAFQRNYTIGLDQHVTAASSAFDGTVALQRFGQQEFRPEIALDDRNSLNFTLRAQDGLKRAAADGGGQDTTFDSFSFTHKIDDAAFNVSHRDPRAASLHYRVEDRELLSAQVTAGGVGNPYLDFVETGYAQNVTIDAPWGDGKHGKLHALTAMGGPENDDGQRNMLAAGEFNYGDPAANIGFTGGALIEDNRALGLRGDGAFALGQGSSTWFAGASAFWQIASDTQFQASWYGGVTQASMARDSLIQDAEAIVSTAWRLGVTRNGLWQDGDSLRFNLAQPLRAETGSLSLNLPQYRLRDGTVIRDNASLGLAPTGREIDFETGYRMPFGEATSLDFAALYRKDSGHVAGENEAIGLARLHHDF
ncbi:MAG: S8 family peptidase [Alphaproteobacteria bacterium]